ncbi:MAG: IS630 family transposase, partial [Clostridiales bacterium]|nr:IS630 family transposase [Clostridiales bacterium]
MLNIALNEVLLNIIQELDEQLTRLEEAGGRKYATYERVLFSDLAAACEIEIRYYKEIQSALECMKSSEPSEPESDKQQSDSPARSVSEAVDLKYKEILTSVIRRKRNRASEDEKEIDLTKNGSASADEEEIGLTKNGSASADEEEVDLTKNGSDSAGEEEIDLTKNGKKIGLQGPGESKSDSNATEGETLFNMDSYKVFVNEESIVFGNLLIRLSDISDAQSFFGPAYICEDGESLLVYDLVEGTQRELPLSFFCENQFFLQLVDGKLMVAAGEEPFEIVKQCEFESLTMLDQAFAKQCEVQMVSLETLIRHMAGARGLEGKMQSEGEKVLASVNTEAKRKGIDVSQLETVDPSTIIIPIQWSILNLDALQLKRYYGKAKAPIVLKVTECKNLKDLAYSVTAPANVIIRARNILMCAAGISAEKTAAMLGLTVKTVRKWRTNYAVSQDMLRCIAVIQPRKLKKCVLTVLSDGHRSGARPTFTACQAAELTRMACSKPEDFGLPYSQWSTRSLCCAYANKTGVRMSESTVARLLNHFGIKPHKVEYWLRTSEKNMRRFLTKALEVLKAYKSAYEDGSRIVFSTDEKTGIQVIERTEVLKAIIGCAAKVDYEYVKHGTTGLTISLNVATGAVEAPMIRPERKEIDFLEHVIELMKRNPGKKITIVCDNLNTHCSASLVWLMEMLKQGVDINDINCDDWRPLKDGGDAGPRLTAEEMERYSHLGVKGKSGILKNMESRSAYLSNLDLQCNFVYTPKHSSWINQVECWFSVISRHLLNSRLSTKSIRELEDRIS